MPEEIQQDIPDDFNAKIIFWKEKPQEFSLYEKYSCVLGKKISVSVAGREPFVAVASKIEPDGRLLLDSGEVLTSAEIKLL